MKIVEINISERYKIEGNATLTCYLNENEGELARYNKSLPAIIVAPGGGYAFVSRREAEPIAIEFLSRHYNVFVLNYDVAPYRYPVPLMQLACSVDYVKRNARKLGVNAKQVFAIGFSAGGHLVGLLSNLYDNLPQKEINGKQLDAKLSGVILSYPVIYPNSHLGSFKNLLGLTDEEATGKKAQKFALQKMVTPNTTPTFIWATREDDCVTVDATIEYSKALSANGVVFESHIFPYGWHGLSTCDTRTNDKKDVSNFQKAQVWLDLANEFLQTL